MRFGSNVSFLAAVGALGLILSAHVAAQDVEHTALHVDAGYSGEVLRQVSGGTRTGTRYLDGMSLNVMMDGELLLGLTGVTACMGVVHGNGETITDLSGARQGISGIEGTSTTRVAELWVERSFGSSDQSLRMGLYDVGSEFSRTASADLFFNQSQTMTPEFSGSGAHGPSTAPATGLGFRYSAQARAWAGRLAVIDGDPGAEEPIGVRLSGREGALVVGEIEHARQAGLRIGSGYWRYTKRFADLRSTDATLSGAGHVSAGIYGFIESPLRIAELADRLQWSARFGAASARTNEIARSYGTALTYSMSSRPMLVGAAVGVAELGTPARSARAVEGLRADRREWIYEVSAAWRATDFLMLKTDIQHVVHPGMNPHLAAPWIVGFHFEVARQWDW